MNTFELFNIISLFVRPAGLQLKFDPLRKKYKNGMNPTMDTERDCPLTL